MWCFRLLDRRSRVGGGWVVGRRDGVRECVDCLVERKIVNIARKSRCMAFRPYESVSGCEGESVGKRISCKKESRDKDAFSACLML